jgi:hypothetical protein
MADPDRAAGRRLGGMADLDRAAARPAVLAGLIPGVGCALARE